MKIDIDVPDGVSGDWKVESFTVSQDRKYGRGTKWQDSWARDLIKR